MKRFWLVLLSLGLVMAFSASAFAVDVKFSGSFEASGMYLDKTNLMKSGSAGGGPSTAFYSQKLQVRMDFIVSPGLKLVTRFNALERIWGGARAGAYDANGTMVGQPGGTSSQSAGTREENQNIAFDWAYIEYASPIGLFKVGYMDDNGWGTVFGDSAINGPPCGQILYILPIGSFYLGGGIFKEADNSFSAINSTATWSDGDEDKYIAFALMTFKGGEAGLLFTYNRVATGKFLSGPPAPLDGTFIPNLAKLYTLQPFAKVKIGPVKVEAEVWYAFGGAQVEDGFVGYDVQLQDIMAYVNAVVDLGVFYVGGTAAYMSGDDPKTTDRMEGSVVGGGMDWNPTLIMFNQDLTYWVGPLPGFGGTANFSGSQPNGPSYMGMTNAWFFQLKAGVRPTAKLDFNASVSYAMADQTAVGQNNSYGWELDVTGTYKITNNLSYMLGVGYWWVGDFYKGGSPTIANGMNDPTVNKLNDEYMIINKLTLTF